MNKEIVIVGLNHRTAPVEMRERIAFDQSLLGETLRCLRALGSVHEGAVLSTCNRVEVVAATFDREAAFAEIKKFLLER